MRQRLAAAPPPLKFKVTLSVHFRSPVIALPVPLLMLCTPVRLHGSTEAPSDESVLTAGSEAFAETYPRFG